MGTARVGPPVVLPLALLLQREPPRDVVQLGRVGQIDEDLRNHTEAVSTAPSAFSTTLTLYLS